MQRERRPYILIPIAAFVAILPLLLHGCSCGHDFDFHILSWMEAARQFTHGNLHPHWAYTPAYNAGEPRFVFYPPLSWTIGAILGLIFPWTSTPILYTWLALTASGLAAYYLARDFTTSTAALIAATLYTVNPYMLFTAYERTAYAELLAAAWIPLLLHAILRKQVTIPRIAIPIALLWLTNAPAAVMSCYALALLTVIRIATTRAIKNRPTTNPGAPFMQSHRTSGHSRDARTAPAHDNPTETASQTPLQLAINTIAGTALGLGLAAFYILPAAYERRYVQIAMAIIPYMRIQDNFLFHHSGDALHDQVLHTASLIAITIIAITAIAITTSFLQRSLNGKLESSASESYIGLGKDASSRPNPERASRVEGAVERPPHFVDASTTSDIKSILTSLAILTIAITLSLTPLTSVIWTHAPELAFLQFPWRLVAILSAVLALSIALALRPIQLNPLATIVATTLVAATLTYPAYTVFHQTCDQEDTVQARLALFHSNKGTEPTDEYTPADADNDSLAQTNPAWWLSKDPNAKAPANKQPGPVPTHLSFKATEPGYLVLNLRDYPSWNITSTDSNSLSLDHPKHIRRDDGLVAIPIYYAADYKINIDYTQTLDQTLGDTFSLASLTLFALLIITRRKKMI